MLIVAACQRNPSKLNEELPSKAAVAETDSVPWPSAPGDTISGTVVETMGASTYTYARLDRNGEQIWIAGPETPLAVGAKIGPLSGTLMKAFHSDSLDRTFPEIYFVNTFGQPVPKSHSAVAAAAPPGELGGTVVETMDAGGYTYAQLVDHAGAKTWVAGPATKLAVGTKVAGMSGTLMTGFRSDTLKRTFDQIYFVNTYTITSGPVAAAAPAPAAAPEVIEKIAPAPNGKTVADIFSGRRELEGKSVALRGKVVKVTSNVLDRNWLHVRDGSGTSGTNDLIVTTNEVVKPGEIVTIHGTVGTNRDLGSNYHYDVLIENATFTR